MLTDSDCDDFISSVYHLKKGKIKFLMPFKNVFIVFKFLQKPWWHPMLYVYPSIKLV